jgi:uncharacterized protein YeaO (DUF488 family)
MVHIKRVYEPASDEDGYRVLVDRLWPRGLSRERARIDLWLKAAAPSDQLRKWFAHVPERFNEFARRYREELSQHPEVMETLHSLESEHGVLTLVYGAHDEEHNQAVVLADALIGQRTASAGAASGPGSRTHAATGR